MSSGANGEWVRQGTPRDDHADWNQEQSEYGTAVSPVEWDDHSNEQSAPVEPLRDQSEDENSPTEAPAESVPGQEPDTEREYRSDEVDPFTVDEPVGDADDDGMDPARLDEPGNAESQDDTVADEHLASTDYEALPVDDAQEMTRPRPVVPDASMAAVGAGNVPEPVLVENDDDDEGAEPVPAENDDEDAEPSEATDLVEETNGSMGDQDLGVPMDGEASTEERHLDAADYLAVDPEPFSAVYSDPVVEDAEPTQYVETDDTEATHHMDTDDSEATQHMDTDDEPTQYVNTDDMESTQAVPLAAAGAAGAAGATAASSSGAVLGDPHHGEATEETAIIKEDEYPTNDAAVEEERLQAQLAAERQAREQRLGAVPAPSEDAVREDDRPARVTTDRFFPSFGLFVLRIVLAGVLGITSFQILRNGVDTTAEFLGTTLIPEPRLVAWILGFALGAMALLLVIGLLQRVVGLLLLAIAVGSLVFIRWGSYAIFDMNVEGFIGDKDLLLAAIGLLLLTIGGGAWGIDGAFRRARTASKAKQLD